MTVIREEISFLITNYKGLTVEETAEMLEEDTETIRKIYDAIKETGTDNIEEIYEKYLMGETSGIPGNVR